LFLLTFQVFRPQPGVDLVADAAQQPPVAADLDDGLDQASRRAGEDRDGNGFRETAVVAFAPYDGGR
jgi:hypothetical protein